jgi:hypothetical protein
MVFNRERANTYANKVQAIRYQRIDNQPDNFTNKSKMNSRSVPNKTRDDVEHAPSDTTSLRDAEKKIDQDSEKHIIDKSNFKPGQPTDKALTPTVTISKEYEAPPELKSAFYKAWTTTSHIIIPVVTHDEISTFCPNSIALMEILSSMDQALDNNEELLWHCPRYFSLPVRIYYCMLFYVQTYRAKEHAKKITKSESSWLRAFFRQFKDTSLSIAGPLVPYFANLVAVLPDDGQFDYVVPDIINGGYKTNSDSLKLTVESTNFLLPSIPLLTSMLHKFCHAKSIDDTFFDENEQYVPFRLKDGGSIGGVKFNPTEAHNLSSEQVKLMNNPAILHPFPESREKLVDIHSFWKRSKAKNVPELNPDEPFDPKGPADYTQLSENLEWFQSCVDLAASHAQFFSESINLSQNPVLGNQSTLVQCSLKLNHNKKTITEVPKTLKHWYPQTYNSVSCRFSATTASLLGDHGFQAGYCLTNTIL